SRQAGLTLGHAANVSARQASKTVQDEPRSCDDRLSRFDIYRTERVSLTSTLFGGGDWHWRLSGSSGGVIADCGGYHDEAQCLAAVEALRAGAAGATIAKRGEWTRFE